MKQSNPSQFVCELIRECRTNQVRGEKNDNDDFESRVKDIMLKYLGEQPRIVYTTPNAGYVETLQDNTQNKIEEIEDPW